jgi:prenylated cyclic peptide (anacyclamide/piricyclamide family)
MKKNLLPQQATPVERKAIAASSASMSAAEVIAQGAGGGRGIPKGVPFAGDDAE